MSSPWRKWLGALDQPVARRYLAIAAVATLVLGVLVLTGQRSGRQAPSRRAAGPDVRPVAQAGPLGDATASPGSAATGPAAVSSASARSSGRVRAPGTSSSQAAKGSALPPITDTTIKVGIAYSQDPGAANAAAGFAGIGQVDQRRAWDAMIAEVNKVSPFGRKLVPVYYSYTTADVGAKGAEGIAQEACARWTKDERVFMAWIGSDIDTLNACLTKAGVAQVGEGAGLSYAKTFQDYPYLVEMNSAALDRTAQFEVDQLYAHGFFSKFKQNDGVNYTPAPPADGRPRIGLIRYDTPAHKAAAATMKRALASHGLALCDGCEFEIGYSSDNVAAQLDDATEINAAVANCKSKNCTHMLFLGSTAGVRITIFSVQRMEDQRYRPRLGFNSYDAPSAVRDFLGESSYPQFRDSMIVSHAPRDLDIRTGAFAKCKALFEAAGETLGGSDDRANNKQNQIPGYCDTAWYVTKALLAAGRTLTLQTWMNLGVANVGPVDSAATYLMRTTADRHDGASAVRIGEWSDDCHCWKQVSGDIVV